MNKLSGVQISKKKDNTVYYRSSITYKSKHITLGSYPTMEEAHKAYKEAHEIINNIHITLLDFSDTNTLSFQRFVSLINVRDNKLYFCNPIYVLPSFFNYYLTPDICLKFDIDDLFYYSSHKIMKRKGHLFVSDYGMQVNIVNRYGIKNFAVQNRDYRFVNGDCYDYRRANIEIINRYQGVQKIMIRNKTMYKAIIHIKGNYVIGTYQTEDEAAISYNKAIDILKKNNCPKKYIHNYLEGLSPSVFADIYSRIDISDKIKKITF